MSEKGSKVLKTVILTLAYDERDSIIKALNNSNLGTRLKVNYTNGKQIIITYEARHENDLFYFGRAFGALEKKNVEFIKHECTLFFCDICKSDTMQSSHFKNVCIDCEKVVQSDIDKLNSEREKNKEPPKIKHEPEPEPEQPKKIIPTFKLNLKNF